MMNPQSIGNPGIDPTLARTLEETVAVVRDLDQRLQVIKSGMLQAFPQLATALSGSPTLGAPGFNPVATPGLLGAPFGVSPYGSPTGALPTNTPNFLPGFVPAPFSPFAHVGASAQGIQVPTSTPFATPGIVGQQNPGVGAPWGQLGGISSFRGFL